MDFAKIANGKSGWVVVPYQGEELKIKYNPSLMTPAYLRKVVDNDGDVGAIAALVSDLVIDWDMVNDGEPVEPSFDFCSLLPLPLLNAIVRVCNEDMSGGKSVNPSTNYGSGSMARGRGRGVQ